MVVVVTDEGAERRKGQFGVSDGKDADKDDFLSLYMLGKPTLYNALCDWFPVSMLVG